uniref:Uncharacterized protein n=1 Tax=viral metagenome TaxID=1070528 RepID=A0A6C0HWF3_9ZZZZ
MDLIIEPDIYSPSIDEHGNYIDKIPSNANMKLGLRCPCGCRKDKVYETPSVFSSHIKTKSHQKWLADLNLNKANYYVENEKLRETIHNQKMVIAKLEKDVVNRNMTIDFLTLQLTKTATNNSNKTTDLLIFD